MSTQTQSISLDKKYQTKSGLPVEITKIYEDARIWAVEGKLYKDDGWKESYWTIDGRFGNFPGSYDLVEIQKPAPMSISLDKQYQTRDGRPVKILSLTDGSPQFPIIGVANPGTEDAAKLSWKTNGTYTHIGATDPSDLIEIPPPEPTCIPYRRYLVDTPNGDAVVHAVSYMNGGAETSRVVRRVESKPNFIRWIDTDWVTHPIKE